jgi:hypothetical protein
VKISIAQSTLEVVSIEIIIGLTIFAHIKEEFVVVAVCKVEALIVVTSDDRVEEGSQNENLNDFFLDHILLTFFFTFFKLWQGCAIYFFSQYTINIEACKKRKEFPQHTSCEVGIFTKTERKSFGKFFFCCLPIGCQEQQGRTFVYHETTDNGIESSREYTHTHIQKK